VSVFTADPQTGRLQFLQNLPSGGKVPRGMGLDPSARWLLIGNQESGQVTEFTRDGQSGKLTPTGIELKIGSPVDVKFVTKD
jgi:6-phosphogluconolactonase